MATVTRIIDLKVIKAIERIREVDWVDLTKTSCFVNFCFTRGEKKAVNECENVPSEAPNRLVRRYR